MTSKPSNQTLEYRAMRLVRMFEGAGKPVKSISIEGKRIELGFDGELPSDEFATVDMCYDKT